MQFQIKFFYENTCLTHNLTFKQPHLFWHGFHIKLLLDTNRSTNTEDCFKKCLSYFYFIHLLYLLWWLLNSCINLFPDSVWVIIIVCDITFIKNLFCINLSRPQSLVLLWRLIHNRAPDIFKSSEIIFININRLIMVINFRKIKLKIICFWWLLRTLLKYF